MNALTLSVKRTLDEDAVANAAAGDLVDYRDAVCCWEHELFQRYPQGHRILQLGEARALIAEIFAACARPAPALWLVPGFADPQIGGYADVARHRILIETGCLYAFLVLHEVAHILAPADLQHGPAFIHVLQMLYRAYLGIPAAAIGALLEKHDLPGCTLCANCRLDDLLRRAT
jgi:hypothetical protein